MTRTKDFNHFSEVARRLIIEEGRMPDVILMEKLNFTPSNWKVWKSKLIEKFSCYTYTKKGEETDEEIKYEIIYDKKEKMWKVNYIYN